MILLYVGSSPVCSARTSAAWKEGGAQREGSAHMCTHLEAKGAPPHTLASHAPSVSAETSVGSSPNVSWPRPQVGEMKRLLLGVLCRDATWVRDAQGHGEEAVVAEVPPGGRAMVGSSMAAAQESNAHERSHERQARELCRRAVGREALEPLCPGLHGDGSADLCDEPLVEGRAPRDVLLNRRAASTTARVAPVGRRTPCLRKHCCDAVPRHAV